VHLTALYDPLDAGTDGTGLDLTLKVPVSCLSVSILVRGLCVKDKNTEAWFMGGST